VLGQPARGSATVAGKDSSSNAVTAPEINAMDQLASASIAQTAAEMTGVGEVVPITNQADSEQAQLSQAAISDDSLATKPQVVQSAYKSNKDIQIYIVQKGDTIPSIADKFNVTSDSIRWSNNLSGNSVNVGRKLRVLPGVDGIIYTVKKGDTAQSLADKYNITEAEVVQYNDAELHGLSIGSLIILPGASKAAQVARTTYSGGGGGYHLTPTYGYNGYDVGYCTWWVAVLRQQAGNPLPTGLGNASSWPYWARVFGLPTGSTPRVGAAVVTSTVGEGHVAYVTAVKGPDTIVVSEMNHNGWYVKDTRTMSGSFFYIY
jgi:surface antigen